MNGIVNILKPPGMTSSDAVIDVRKIFEIKRVGHSGTLDPGASGVLPILIGNATRLFDYMLDKDKEYIAEVTFGSSTDTQDSYGNTIQKMDCDIDCEDFKNAILKFKGSILKKTPMYSAAKYNGRKLYELAREGKEVESKNREITIHDIELSKQVCPNRFLFRVVCSKGTYVRTLCCDIGTVLGVPAHMSFLLRTRCGKFGLDSAYSIAELREMKERGELEKAVLPMDIALMQLDEISIEPTELNRKRVLNGLTVNLDSKNDDVKEIRVYCGEFIGIGNIKNNKLHVDTKLCGGDNE